MADGAGPLWLAPRNPMGRVFMTILIFNILVFGLALPVMLLVDRVPVGLAVAACGVAIVLAMAAVALLRKPVGAVLGWLTQLAGVALGLLTPAMYAVGVMFLGLWLLAFVLGRRLDAAARVQP